MMMINGDDDDHDDDALPVVAEVSGKAQAVAVYIDNIDLYVWYIYLYGI